MVLAENFGLTRGKLIDLGQRLVIAPEIHQNAAPQPTGCQDIGMTFTPAFRDAGYNKLRPIESLRIITNSSLISAARCSTAEPCAPQCRAPRKSDVRRTIAENRGQTIQSLFVTIQSYGINRPYRRKELLAGRRVAAPSPNSTRLASRHRASAVPEDPR